MKQRQKQILSLVLCAVTLFLCGCRSKLPPPFSQAPSVGSSSVPTSAPASTEEPDASRDLVESVPPSARSSAPSSAPEPNPPAPYQYADTWQQGYFNVIAMPLSYGGILSQAFGLLWPDEGDPYLYRIHQRYDGTRLEIWCRDETFTELLYSTPPGQGHYFPDIAVNLTNGHLLMNEGAGSKRIYYDLDPRQNTKVLLYEEWVASDYYDLDATQCYVYAEDKPYTYRDCIVFNPMDEINKNYTVLDTSTGYSLPDSSAGDQRQYLTQFFLNTYNPVIPPEAPAWVETYLRYVYFQANIVFSYPDARQDSVISYPLSFSLVEPLEEGAAPVIRMDPANTGRGYCHYIYNDTVFVLKPPRTTSQYYFVETMYGKPLLMEYTEHGRDVCVNYYAFRGERPVLLFKIGLRASSVQAGGYNYAAYAGARWVEDVSYDSASLWLGDMIARELESNGIAGARGYLPETTVQIGAGGWAGIEWQLINALCEYAREIGQWGG